MKNLKIMKSKNEKKREPYEAPAIIYEGLITTSSKGTLSPSSDDDGSDPANIFQGSDG